MPNLFKAFLLIIFFLSSGLLLWKYSKIKTFEPIENFKEVAKKHEEKILTVDNEEITEEDLEFEYQLHTLGLVEKSDLTPVPDLGKNYNKELPKLKYELLSNMVERKMLYHYITQEKSFAKTIKVNQKDCIREWQETIHEDIQLLRSEENQLRLKARICELTALQLYMETVLFPKIQITEEEIIEYYKNHVNEFKHPKMVLIRQIVLAEESQAKKVRNKATRQNFPQLAKEYSITPEAEKGGLLGPYKKGDLPPVFDIAFRLRKGDISTIQKSTYGFHIIMVEKKIDQREIGLEEAKKDITSALTEKKKNWEYKKWVELAQHSIQVKSTQPLW
ncbi:MAG: peptidyl-prolyl cis-trans isomerase [Bdellovibrionota bacterium]